MNPQRTSNILRIEPNVPMELALENPTGLEVEGKFGPQVLFTLTDRRRLYVPLEAGNPLPLARTRPAVHRYQGPARRPALHQLGDRAQARAGFGDARSR